VLKFGLTALNPVAREKLIELMSDGVLVLSAEDRIADINPAGERLLGISSGVAVGRLLSELLPQYLPIIEKYRHIYEEKTELHLVDGRFIDLTITPLNDSKQKYGGRLILRYIRRKEGGVGPGSGTGFLCSGYVSHAKWYRRYRCRPEICVYKPGFWPAGGNGSGTGTWLLYDRFH
jgi:PAS domain-containing protein